MAEEQMPTWDEKHKIWIWITVSVIIVIIAIGVWPHGNKSNISIAPTPVDTLEKARADIDAIRLVVQSNVTKIDNLSSEIQTLKALSNDISVQLNTLKNNQQTGGTTHLLSKIDMLINLINTYSIENADMEKKIISLTNEIETIKRSLP